MTDITRLLQDASQGDQAAGDRAFSLLYDELRRIAHARLRDAGTQHQLSTTVVVHEAFVRLRAAQVPAANLAFPDRKHFLSYASRAMRSVVVDMARSRLAERHGGNSHHTALDTAVVDNGPAAQDEEVLRVHEGLAALAAAEPRLAQVVELRYFVGLGDAEIATLLDVTERTVQRDWKKARLFLATALR